MMAARYSAMFVIGAAEVQTSGQPPVGRKATKSLVKLATDHMNKVSDADIKALSNLFGNFDRRVGLGWLLGDAVRPAGSPLPDGAGGCVCSRCEGAARRGQDQDRRPRRQARNSARALQKLATDDPRREALQVEVEGVEAEVLRTDVDLPLPPVTPAPAAAAAAKPTGSRKRAREAEPSHEEMMEEFQEGLLVCKKWVNEAEADVASAAEKHKKKAAVVARSGREKVRGEAQAQADHALLQGTGRCA